MRTLSEEERERLEERYFSDDAEFEELEIAEEELIDKYVRSKLAHTERDQFEKALAVSPRLMERVQVARILAERLKSASSPITKVPAQEPARHREEASWWARVFGISTGSRAPRLAVGFSVVLVLLGGLALLFGWLRLREESRQLATQRSALEQHQRELDKQAAEIKTQLDQLANRTPSPTPTEVPQPKPSEEPPSIGRSVFAITLSPGTVRSGGGANKAISIPAGTGTLELTLSLRDASYPTYQATILTADRKPIFRSPTLRIRHTSSGDVLTLSVPAKHLPPGDYLISVDGRTSAGATESVDDYVFRVTK